MITTVFFDLGGTLVVMRRDIVIEKILMQEGYSVPRERIHRAYYEVEDRWLEKYGMKMMTEEESIKAYSELNVEIISRLGLNLSPDELRRLKHVVSDRWVEVENSIEPILYPDSLPVLEFLKNKGYKVGVISNAPPSTMDSVRKTGIDKYADAILISGIVGLSKPNPELFRLALKEINSEPRDSVHVGDLYIADVLGARSAGMNAVLIDREGRYNTVDCPKIASLFELKEIITKI